SVVAQPQDFLLGEPVPDVRPVDGQHHVRHVFLLGIDLDVPRQLIGGVPLLALGLLVERPHVVLLGFVGPHIGERKCGLQRLHRRTDHVVLAFGRLQGGHLSLRVSARYFSRAACSSLRRTKSTTGSDASSACPTSRCASSAASLAVTCLVKKRTSRSASSPISST